MAFAGLALLVLSPVILAIALAIKLEDGGSVLYSQDRTASFGDTFTVAKFRSMVEDAEPEEDEAAGKGEAEVVSLDAFRKRSTGDTILELVMGVLSIAAGVVILIAPGTGMLSLTLVLGAFFAADGVMRLIHAFRGDGGARRGWLIGGGVLSLLLAGLIVFALPGSAAYTIGLLFGVHLLFLGVSLIALRREEEGGRVREA